ncbi:uridine kinase [Mesoplasma syrphidae]|uniref:Uridine kinase n=1 Tax=Mesoplasma syrphidae TaxID=225999 RepID=A0A2K9C947_9MOLU|nr:uridine kinase [Mesoplasma syrphidae]AUF83545.1 uridine kinase [Mesoplasma syrphidae]
MKPVQIILIAGGSASGKTTVAKRIANVILKDKSVTYLSMDNYYKNFPEMTLQERKKMNFDHPNIMDIDLMVKQLVELKKRQAIEVPKYDFTTSLRMKETFRVEPADVIIIDGIFTLHIDKIRKFGDIKLFIKTPDDVRFIRRLTRDIEERGFTTDQVINQYLETVKPMHDFFVGPSIDFADVIIPYQEGNEVAIDLVATKVASWVD